MATKTKKPSSEPKQTFCGCCGGIKKMTVAGKVVSWRDWPRYMVAVDAGCVCPKVGK